MPNHLSTLALIALAFSGLVDTVRATHAKEIRTGLSAFNIEGACKDVAKSELNKTTNYSGCVSDERKAQEQLEKNWASYPADMRSQCMHLVTPPALPSYVTLRQCLDTAREAQRLLKTDKQTGVEKEMEPRSGQ